MMCEKLMEATYCLHPIEFTTMYDWIQTDEETLIIAGKCRLCGSNYQITVIKDPELIMRSNDQ